MESNSLKVFTALRYLVRWEKPLLSGMLSARNDARLRYPRVSEALARSVGPAGQTGYPRAQSIYLALSRPTPFRQSAAQKGCKKKKAASWDSLSGKCKILAHLFSRKTLWARGHGHPLQTDADGARADEDDFVPCCAKAHDGFHDGGECG
jgi:hypothetical protein